MRTLAALVLGGVILCPIAAGAQAELPAVMLERTTEPGVEQLLVGNRAVFEFRATVLGYSPEQRANLARERIRTVMSSKQRGTRTVTVTTLLVGDLTQVLADGNLLFMIAPVDVNQLRGETYDDLVSQTTLRLKAGLEAYLAQRAVPQLIRSIALALAATAMLVAIFVAARRLSRRLMARLETVASTRVGKLNLPETPITTQILPLVRLVVRVVSVVLGLLLINIWATFVLKQFPYTYPWGDQFDDYLIQLGTAVGMAILHAIPHLAILTVIFLITRAVVQWIKHFFRHVQAGTVQMGGIDSDTAIPAQRLVVVFVYFLALAIAFPYIPGSDGTAFKGLSVLFGVMLSLGSSNVVSQAASGYILVFSRALRVGDYVRVAEFEGTVVSLGALSAKLRTAAEEEINVPNSVFVGSITRNFTRLSGANGAPLTTTVTIGYGTPWRQVHAMLKDAALRTKGLRRVAEPVVLQRSLSDFYIEYALVVRLEDASTRYQVLSDLHANVQDCFNENGVQIMSPHYEADPAAPVWVPRDKWHDSPAPPPSSQS